MKGMKPQLPSFFAVWVLLLSISPALAQSSGSATNYPRRARLADATEQPQSDARLQPLDRSSEGLIDASVTANLLDQFGNTSEHGLSAESANQQIPTALMHRCHPGSAPVERADGLPQGDPASQSIDWNEDAPVRAVSVQADVLLAQPDVAMNSNQSSPGAFPQSNSTRVPRPPDKIVHSKAPRTKQSSHELAGAISASPSWPPARRELKAAHSDHTGTAPSQSQLRFKRPHRRPTATPFSTFTSSQ